MDASCSECHPGKKCLVGRSRGSPGRCCLYWPPFRHRSPIIGISASSSRSGRLMRMERVRSWMPGSMWIGSHWTQGSLLTSSLNYTMAYSMMFSHRKASMGWRPASTCRLVVSFLLPGSLEVEDWLLLARPEKKHVANADDHTHTQWQVIYLRSNLCAENVDGWSHDTSGWHLIHSG